MTNAELVERIDANYRAAFVAMARTPAGGAAVIGERITLTATDTSHRASGLGEAVTWHAIRRGRELGCDIAGLRASRLGRPIHERMGFRIVSPYREHRRPTAPADDPVNRDESET